MTNKKEADDLFNPENEQKGNWFGFGKEGNFIAGTLISVRKMKSTLPGKEGVEMPVYEIKADRGEFNPLDEDKKPMDLLTIEPGQIWNVGGRMGLDEQMRNVRVGTKIGIKYTETRAAQKKGLNPFKVVKLYIKRGEDNKPIMDEAWLKERAENSAADATFDAM